MHTPVCGIRASALVFIVHILSVDDVCVCVCVFANSARQAKHDDAPYTKHSQLYIVEVARTMPFCFVFFFHYFRLMWRCRCGMQPRRVINAVVRTNAFGMFNGLPWPRYVNDPKCVLQMIEWLEALTWNRWPLKDTNTITMDQNEIKKKTTIEIASISKQTHLIFARTQNDATNRMRTCSAWTKMKFFSYLFANH